MEPEQMGFVRRYLGNMSMAFAAAMTIIVVASVATGGYLIAKRHEAQVLNAVSAGARGQSELIRETLEHQMLENRRDLIREMVNGFGSRQPIQRVMILDRRGQRKFSSTGESSEPALNVESPTCMACHSKPPDKRAESVVINTQDGAVLRTVLPIFNRPECHGCHESSHHINGVLIVDVSAADMQTALATDVRWIALGSGGLALVLLTAMAGALRLMVLRRLRRFEEAARGIAAGDLSRRVPITGDDTLGWLAKEFNVVADFASHHLAEVSAEQEKLETILNSVDDGIVVLDKGLRVVAANDAYLERTSASRASLVGARCGAARSGLCNPSRCPTRASFDSGERSTAMITRTAADGKECYEEVRSSPIRAEDGTVKYVVEVWRDITARRLAEARMAESHRLASLGLLASGFSHELNTPLGSVLTCVESILRSAEEKDKQPDDAEFAAEMARLARSELIRCRGITQQFLRMSRGQGSTAEAVDLRAVLDAVLRLVLPTAKERKVSVEVEQPITVPPVHANDPELQQVLLNLLLNAIQACEPGGKIRIDARVEGERNVVLRVVDDGRGISNENIARVFDPFFSMRKDGTGLGLFVSKNLVRAVGGDIRVQSEEGKGSTFEVELTRADLTAVEGEDRGGERESVTC